MQNFFILAIALASVVGIVFSNPIIEKSLIRVRRGNYGERNSGGIGAGSSHGVGYGGSSVLGSHYNPPSPLVLDHYALSAISGPAQGVLDGYQAQINAQASSAQSLDRLQQQGQHRAAHAGYRASQVSNWYNTIATGHVPELYKGERG